MKKLKSVTISQANLTGYLPKHWHLNLTHVDLSGNRLRGKIPSSITLLENLQLLNLSSNLLLGEIPTSIGDLLSLQNVSLASNSLSGSIPESLASIPALVHLDLGSNQLNGTVPKFIANMKGLKYLNLEKNNFDGVMPFNASFIKRLVVFKIGGNTNLCYNHSIFSPKLKLGIAPCDKHGLPLSPPPAKDSSAADSSDGASTDDYSMADDSSKKKKKPRGPITTKCLPAKDSSSDDNRDGESTEKVLTIITVFELRVDRRSNILMDKCDWQGISQCFVTIAGNGIGGVQINAGRWVTNANNNKT
ncbi:unnamed protein product [Camellia sinensis]